MQFTNVETVKVYSLIMKIGREKIIGARKWRYFRVCHSSVWLSPIRVKDCEKNENLLLLRANENKIHIIFHFRDKTGKYPNGISIFFIDRSITRSYGSIDFVQMLEKYVRDGYSSKNDTNRVNLHFGQNSNLFEYDFV